jgi:hypothetical protein
MPNTTTSQYMLLPVPVPTVDPGPQYATDLNTCLTTIDQHDHSTGKGTPVTPSGLNINADLSYASGGTSYNAKSLRSIRFTAQPSPLSLATDLGCVYESGVDLYYNDGNGNQIRMTNSGSVAGGAGSIGGLTPPASVTYNSGTQTFVFQSTTATAANLDAGSLIIRQVLANAKGITLSSPSALANNYTLTLPTGNASASNSFVVSDTAGNLSYTNVDNITTTISSSGISLKQQGVTINYLAPKLLTTGSALGQASYQDIFAFVTRSIFPNYDNVATLTIPITGVRPVYIGLIPSSASVGTIINDSSTATAQLRIYRNADLITTCNFNTIGTMPSSIFYTYDFAPSSTYTYTLKGAVSSSAGGNGLEITSSKFLIFEQ